MICLKHKKVKLAYKTSLKFTTFYNTMHFKFIEITCIYGLNLLDMRLYVCIYIKYFK